jgi:hypothetical protein
MVFSSKKSFQFFEPKFISLLSALTLKFNALKQNLIILKLLGNASFGNLFEKFFCVETKCN